jgi:peptidyl-dipeptidase Dcp
MENPLLTEYTTPYQVPPFDLIKKEHYKPAFEKAMEAHKAEIQAIIDNTDAPSFENTIAAFDIAGLMLNNINNTFFNLLSTMSDDEMQEIAKDVSPLLSKHSDDILLNAKLFAKIKAVYDQKDQLTLTPEQKQVLTEIYKRFARGGANLDAEKQTRLREINEKLTTLSLQFGDNLLAENNNFTLVIDKKEDLIGLPENLIASAAETAKEKAQEGKWIFTLHRPSSMPFLEFSANRALREKMFKAYANMGNNNVKFDNKKIVNEIVNLRIEKAKLFGFNSFAEYTLDDRMAKTPENVYALLDKVWTPALKAAKADAAEFQKIINKEGGKFKLEAWDWSYYAAKLQAEKYSIDSEKVKEYFSLENARNGLFTVIEKLWGLKMVERNDIPKYHPDVVVYEVQEADGSHVGILYMDFFVRPSKRSGAWMTNFREQYSKDGKRVAPVISIVLNYPKPVGDKPVLLTFDEVSTMFHEFGHALHGLLSNTVYYTLSGTNVARDFVELPSQIMENWATEPEVLKMYAKHYQTAEVIPDEMIKKLEESANFNQGFAAVEYLAASYLDMAWHNINQPQEFDIIKFENQQLTAKNLIPEIISRYKTSYFQHIFSGGYATGYYSYIWAEVLDADAFQAFKETSLFDQATAQAFRKNILEKGGTEDQMELYKRFRGAEPKIEPLLKRKGFL